VKIAQLEIELSTLKAQMAEANTRIEGLTSGLAHVVDVLVPELAQPNTEAARRKELGQVANSIRTQFLGERVSA
jgi:hypothetical protein